MSRIPDCRTDEAYNEKYLNEVDSECITGYDLSIEDNINNFFNNISNYTENIADALGLAEEEIENLNIDEELIASDEPYDEYSDIQLREMGKVNALLVLLKDRMLTWAESSRDELITSMIDNMDDDEYEDLKKKVDAGEHKNAIIRQREHWEKYEAGEIPTCWTHKIDENGNHIKIGHCPNGTTVVEQWK